MPDDATRGASKPDDGTPEDAVAEGSLASRLFLLSWDPARSKRAEPEHLAHLVQAGALTDLALRGLLTDDDGTVTPVGDTRTGDPALDGLLQLIAESRPRSWKTWVTHEARLTLDAVRTQELDAGRLRVESKRVLGMFPSRTYLLERPDVVEGLRADVFRLLRDPGDVSQVPERDAALIALAAAGELEAVLPRAERKRYAGRIAALTERGGSAAPALKRAIEEVRAAVLVTITAVTTVVVTAGGS